ncbi:uncharacterized protein F5Z01DRAFT_666190 [Emericellopsis atlantica]|uniref:GPI anchored serine-rich protein n=1 Tax=Emericellopsis atlantica TaxID=2614577 RepID=A0A9P7ZF87_9HYPO|nr:uncharacterized protein F5Z01DRAFT_666190 [Emericellopsis atlantica]KAG9250490.1 hypothetical protein F5Z01DRAFT_666190 [Emericellopsis atlantica]
MKASTILVAAAATLAQATSWHQNTTLITTVSQTATVTECSSEYPHNPTTYTPVPMPTVSTRIPVLPPGNGTIIPPPHGGNGTVPTSTRSGGNEPTNFPVAPTNTGEPDVPGAAALNNAGKAALAGAGLAGVFFLL